MFEDKLLWLVLEQPLGFPQVLVRLSDSADFTVLFFFSKQQVSHQD